MDWLRSKEDESIFFVSYVCKLALANAETQILA